MSTDRFELDEHRKVDVTALVKENPVIRHQQTGRWWRYAVLRGDGIPAEINGRWYDLDDTNTIPSTFARVGGPAATVEATNRWEQRGDGAVAVVYEWTRR